QARLNEDDDLGLEVNEDSGVLIVRVLEDTPAAAGGLQPGDVIQSVNGIVVETPTDVQSQVDAGEVGEPLSVQVKRGDKVENIEVRPMALPAQLQ
ncbi:MAG: PDZ domain-containing protein, partial [Cyanobacteria bacterium P01_H01_bin.58]